MKKDKKNKKRNKKAELIKLNPRSFPDSIEIARHLKNGNVLIVNFEALKNNEILRIIDFVTGVLFVVGGTYKKVSDKTYLLSPNEELLNKFSDSI